MIKSMTGYGKNTLQVEEGEITVEIKSVNNKYSKIYSDLPDFLSKYEVEFENKIKNALERGTINFDIEFNKDESKESELQFNTEKLEKIYTGLINACRDLGIEQKVGIEDVLKFSEYLIQEEEVTPENFIDDIQGLIDETLAEVQAMREQEGESLKVELKDYINGISENVQAVKEKSEVVKSNLYEKCKENIQEIVEDVEVDRDRIVQEAAITAKKLDITEECDRVKSHTKQFLKYLDTDESVGKKLKFLAQELHRELNTIGAKANDSEVSHLIVEAKNDVEKVKEQVRNIL